MTTCTIRIELHDAIWTDYTNLATYLSQKGIVDVIVANDGQRYKMSGGHYNYVGHKSFTQVYDDAVYCAALTGKRYGVTASEATVTRWVGLPNV